MSSTTPRSLRIWYSGVFAVGATAIVAGGLLARPPIDAPMAGAERTSTAGVVLLTANPTASAKAKAASIKQWQAKTSAALGELNTALLDFQAASESKNAPAMQDACARIGAAGEAIGAALPGPSASVNDPLGAAAHDFRSAGSKCGDLSGGSAESIMNDIQSGIANVQTAQGAIAKTGG